ncbi:exported hypothetical protein [Candidatus Zixiibacteriota bacterium]|nr:exported hypothetical protein [candidate division Zixibacteria bacterium]
MRKVIFVFMVALLTLAGCSRHIDSPDVPFDLPKQPPVPSGLKLAHTAGGMDLSWQISDSALVRYFKVYLADSLDGTYRLQDSTGDYSLTMTDLSNGQPYYFRVSAVISGGVEGEKSSAVASIFGTMAISINNNDKYTNSQTVSISFVVPVTASLMQLSEDSSFAGSSWQTYVSPTNKELSSGDGLKKVYARFQFNDGSSSEKAVSDSIILDTRAFIDSTYFTSSLPNPVAGDAVTFFVVTHESGGTAYVSFSSISRLDLYDDGSNGDVTANDGIYSRLYIIPADLEVVNGLVSGHFQDAAGNNADVRPAQIRLNILKAPTPITLSATTQSSSSIRLSWSQETDNDFASYQIYRSPNATVNTGSDLVTIITSRTTLSYSDDNLEANKAYYYRIYVFDNTGLSTASNITSDTTQINIAPTAVQLAIQINGDSSIMTWTTNGDADFGSYQIYRGTTPGITNLNATLLAIINEQSTTTFTDNRPTASTYYYRVYVYDKQGMLTGSNEVAAP